MKSKRTRSNGMLALTALIWGAAFVAQSVGMDYVGPFTFNAVRFFIGGIVLIPCIYLIKKINQRQEIQRVERGEKPCDISQNGRKTGVIGGICCGMVLFVASSFQQIGVSYTTVGKAGFITALYIIIVPILGIFMKKKVAFSLWISVAIATIGMYLLCMSGGSLSVSKGDLYVLVCSVCFSFHILIIDYFSPKADGVFMSCIQFFTAGVLALCPTLLFEHPTVSSLVAAWAPVLYAGVMSCGVAYTLQVVAQKDTEPVVASLILSLESVFSLITGWILLGQKLSARELLGCTLVFAALVLAQLPMDQLIKKYREGRKSSQSKMTSREKAVIFLLIVACAVSVWIPVTGLLAKGGVYSWHLAQPEFRAMILEISALFLVLSGVWVFITDRKRRLLFTGLIGIGFVWCHVVFLPMLISGIYILYLWLTGYTFRMAICRKEQKEHGFADFLTGCGLVILLFCLMSLLGVGSISAMRTVAVVSGGLELLFLAWNDKKKDWKWSCPQVDSTKFQRLFVAFIVLMVLIQIGRMNISLDFDSLWYGVRSEYLLNNGQGIYENPGTVGVVYSYSKGLEILLLPLSDLISHSYLTFFNVWVAVLTLAAVYRVGRCYMGRTYALLATACVSSIPAVMNMSITAKSDSMTLLVQMIMILYFLRYVSEKEGKNLLISAGALILSWVLKPTALVFSTAVFGMGFLYLAGTRQFSLKSSWKDWLLPGICLAVLGAVWGRTWFITGLPVTSVFSSVFLKLGFTMKYPFTPLPISSGAGGFSMSYLAKTIGHMLLFPVGEDMSHVVIAWGTSLVFFLLLLCMVTVAVKKRKPMGMNTDSSRAQELLHLAHVVLIPFVLVCVISLLTLSQIDGNYFMLLYVFVLLYGCGVISRLERVQLRTCTLLLLIPVLGLNLVMTAVSNWAWSLGFTPVQIVNSGRYDHEQIQQETMENLGNAAIWEILSQNSRTRVIAAGNHPEVFHFPCNVQSYDDITSAWGNVALVKTMNDFVEYLHYAGTDYIYMQAGAVSPDSRCYELMGYLIEAGILTEVFYENGNMLAAVNLQGQPGEKETEAYQTYLETYQVQ